MSFRIKPASNTLKVDEPIRPGEHKRTRTSIMSFLRSDAEVPVSAHTRSMPPKSTRMRPTRPTEGSSKGMAIRVVDGAQVDSM